MLPISFQLPVEIIVSRPLTFSYYVRAKSDTVPPYGTRDKAWRVATRVSLFTSHAFYIYSCFISTEELIDIFEHHFLVEAYTKVRFSLS